MRATGEAYWAWTIEQPGDFNSFAPTVVNADGTFSSTGRPDDIVVDFEAQGLLDTDMQQLHQTLAQTRLRVDKSGKLSMTYVVNGNTEIDHPMLSIVNFRRQQKGLAPIAGAAVVVGE